MSRAGDPGRRRVGQKVAATLAVLGAVAAFELFVTAGSFDGGHDPFPQSVVVQPAVAPPVG